jgi:hypothetical protein
VGGRNVAENDARSSRFHVLTFLEESATLALLLSWRIDCYDAPVARRLSRHITQLSIISPRLMHYDLLGVHRSGIFTKRE